MVQQKIRSLFYRPLFSFDGYKNLKKINLASSDHIIPGWMNVDIRKVAGIDQIVDVRDLSAFADDSFDIVRASHILEHFYVDEVPNVLAEWRRVLKPGGWMIVCVPSFRATILRYKVNPHTINPCLIEEFGPAVLSQIYGYGYTNAENHYYKHRMAYDRRSLAMVMEKYAGLRNVRLLNFLAEPPHTLGVVDDSTNVYSLNLAGQKS